MKYIVFEYVGLGTLYAVPADDKQELAAIKELVLDEYPDRMRKVGEFISEQPLPYDWRFFACVQHHKETCPAYRLVKKTNKNMDYML